MKISKILLPHQSFVIGWILIIVDPVDVLLFGRRMVLEKSMRSAFSVGDKINMFVETSLVQRNM